MTPDERAGLEAEIKLIQSKRMNHSNLRYNLLHTMLSIEQCHPGHGSLSTLRALSTDADTIVHSCDSDVVAIRERLKIDTANRRSQPREMTMNLPRPRR